MSNHEQEENPVCKPNAIEAWLNLLAKISYEKVWPRPKSEILFRNRLEESGSQGSETPPVPGTDNQNS